MLDTLLVRCYALRTTRRNEAEYFVPRDQWPFLCATVARLPLFVCTRLCWLAHSKEFPMHCRSLLTPILLTLCTGLSLQACSLTPPDLPAAPTPSPTVAAAQALLALPDCSFEQGRAPQVASYCMKVRLDPRAKTIVGIERITYRNLSSDMLKEVWLRLYLRAFRDLNTLWMRESGGQSRGFPINSNELGDITIGTLTLAGADLLASTSLTDTLMRVPLPQPLAPGQSLDLDVSWVGKLPKVFARTGYGGRDDTFFMVGQWYPKLAVYDRGNWDTEPWHANSEFFNDFGSYDVSIVVPREYVVAGAGLPVGEQESSDGVKTLRFTSATVTDFAFAATPDFKTRSAKAGDVDVELFYLPEHAASVDEYLKAATGSLQAYSLWYGAYQHPRLTVVDVPDDAGGAGGMEYPTLITGGTFGAPANNGLVALIVSHEVGHQWWPMQTATNEGREPWLDEGLTEYSGVRYMAEAGRELGFGAQPVDMVRFEQSQYLATQEPATLPAWKYTTNAYAAAVYSKSALGLWMLESIVGTARLRRAMADYLAQYRFKHPTGADFRSSLERSLGPQSWFFDDYMNGRGIVDYAAGAIATTASGSTAQVSQEGTVRVPVEIRITLADGSQQIKTWDGQTPSASFTFSAADAVKKVEVDPEHKLKAELRTTNNTASANPSETSSR
jgi:hypothetical protein